MTVQPVSLTLLAGMARPTDPIDRVYESLIYMKLMKTCRKNTTNMKTDILNNHDVKTLLLSRFILHFTKGVFMGAGMYATFACVQSADHHSC